MGTPRPDWATLRWQLWQRAGGRCEASGVAIDLHTFDAHHRRNKGMGGTSRPDRDAVWNLVALDPLVHNGGPASVHGDRPRWQGRGFLVPKHEDHPERWPVLLWDGRWVLLTRSAGYAVVGRG
jgi:hypothetical protein